MADKSVGELIAAQSVTPTDLFVLEQNGTAKKLTGQTLENWLVSFADGHGGIQSIVKHSTSGLVDTYRITLADTTTFDFTVTNGKAISSVEQTSEEGLTRTYTIAFNDNTSQTFTVTDGRSITKIEKTRTDGLADTFTISYNDGTTSTFVVMNGRGIQLFEKVSTSGLKHTYRFSYNDGTSNEFTVTDGEKGDKGDNTYTHFKFASQQPTDTSHSMGDIPDNWIGMYWGPLENAPTDWKQYKWFKIIGEKGDTGDPATLMSSKVEYQVSDSGTIIPSGSWSASVPVVAQGRYLWTRTTNNFNTGNPVVSYSVSRMGLDGSGSVSSVADISPDEHGNVPLTAADVGALPSTGGDLTGELKMNGQPISGLNPPTANAHAANMGYVNSQVKKAAPRNLLDNSDWRVKKLIVNQIGQDSYTLGAWDGYTIDRWYVHEQDTNLSFVNNGIQLTGVLAQTCQSGTLIYGKQYTMAVKINGEVYCSNGTLQHTGEWHRVVEYFGENFHFQLTAADYDDYAVQIYGTDAVYEWAALYEGEYTTDTLPEYQPKGYAAELAECKRYFRILRGDPTLSGYIGSAATTVYVLYNDRMDMRKDTSIDVAVTGQVDVICNGTYYSANVLSAICDQAQFALNVQYIADTPPIKMPCMVYAYGNIQLSANL